MKGNSKNKATSSGIFRAMLRVAHINLRVAPVRYFFYALLSLTSGVLIGIIAPLNKSLFDALENLVNGHGIMRNVIIAAVFVTLVMLCSQIISALKSFYGSSVIAQVVKGRLMRKVHSKIKTLPVIYFEDKEKLDDIEKAGPGLESSIILFSEFISFIFYYFSYYVIMGLFLWSIRPILLISLFLTVIPTIFAQVIEAKLKTLLEHESAQIRRQNDHYADCLIGSDKMKETRLFGAYNFFKKLYMNSLELLTTKEWTVQKRTSLINLFMNLLKAIGWIFVIILLFQSLVAGYVSIGGFAAVLASLGTFFGLVQELTNRVRYSLTQNIGKIQNYVRFLDEQVECGEELLTDLTAGISAVNVSFSYPKASCLVIDNVTLNIKAGETIAIVGENGSGKTTLVKLLVGIFAPDSGKVTIGGKDTTSASMKTLFHGTSAVFQDFACYDYSLDENVRLSDTGAKSNSEVALKSADIEPKDKSTFPFGIDTILSRAFGGVQLSYGQWQRISIARGLYRTHEFIVLDEPTASIDPIEEQRVYRKFADMARNKTAILVTHRLSATKIADKIIVMKDGGIVEEGTHGELLAKDNVYSKMWKLQSIHYK